MEKVSIIVPIYNVEKYVIKCIDSLLQQTYKNIEILAISDGSKDDSIRILREKYSNEEKLKIIEKDNGGFGSVLEFAISIIESKYFLICDPDDWLENKAVDRLVGVAEKDNLDLVVGDKYLVYMDKSESDKKIKKSCSEVYFKINSKTIYEGAEIGKFAFLDVSPHAKLFRTNLVKNIKFPKKVSYTDFLLYLCALSNSKRVEYIEEPLANYLIDRPGNTATDVSPKIINYYVNVWKSTYEEINHKSVTINYIYYRLFLQMKSILKMYGKCKERNYAHEKEINEIYFIICQNKSEIRNVLNTQKRKKRIINKMLMNEKVFKSVFDFINFIRR